MTIGSLIIIAVAVAGIAKWWKHREAIAAEIEGKRLHPHDRIVFKKGASERPRVYHDRPLDVEELDEMFK